MDLELVEKEAFTIVGTALRTCNQDGQAERELPEHWAHYIAEDLLHETPHRKSDEMVGLYVDYESDYLHPYTLISGCQVTEVGKLPPGTIARQVPAATYARFVARGDFPQCLIELWQHIWSLPLKRTYMADFELYPENVLTAPEVVVEVFIAVQS